MLTSSLSGTGVVFNGSTISLVGCVDTTNTLPGASSLAGCPATFNAPTITTTPTSSPYGPPATSLSISSLSGPYALDEKITVTLAAGANFDITATQTLVQTPEPMSIVLLGSLLLTVGLVGRKHKQGSKV